MSAAPTTEDATVKGSCLYGQVSLEFYLQDYSNA